MGVIGTGVMGADHVHTLSTVVAGAQVGAVHDVDAVRAAAAIEGLGRARVVDDPFELIGDPAVHAVLIASADATHEQYVLAGLAAGKPVLCEKPLAPTVAGCRTVLDAEVAGGRRLVSVGFMRRYDPGYLELKRTLDAGAIGPALMLHSVHRNPATAPGVTSAVLVRGSAVHEFDISRWLLGEEIVAASVYAPRPSARRPIPPAGLEHDPLFVVLETAGGVVVDVEVFGNAGYGYDVRCELVGTSGAATLGETGATTVRTAHRRARPIPADWRDRFADAYRRELQDWVDGLRAGEARGASAWDAYAATAVADAAVLALETGRRTDVRLDPRPPLYGP